VLIVSPNNPTGSMLRAADRDWLVDLSASRGLAIIADEVFAPYPLAAPRDAVSLSGEDRVLVFALGGLSKSAGMPQMKLAWTVVGGPPEIVGEALSRLELIADTYLSVSTPVQVALPRLLDAGRARRTVLTARLRQNLDTLRSVVSGAPSLTLLEPDGGWSAVVRVPAIQAEEDLVIRLIESESVLVHPGYFFDFDDEAYLVVSLLPRPDVFEQGMKRVARFCHAGAPA
jgi:aspartate/methionine/tyrosine aminotransferase